MKDKKVIFVHVRDVIDIPSKEDNPKNFTDFNLNFNFAQALKSIPGIVYVNLIGDNVFCNGNISEYDCLGMLSVLSHEILVYTEKAVSYYLSYGKDFNGNLEDAVSMTGKIDIFQDRGCWLALGRIGAGEGIDFETISMEDFCNGGIDELAKGTEGREKK